MKKLSIILTGLLFVFLFSACGGNSKNIEKTDNTKEEVTDTKTDEVVVTQKTQTELIVGNWYDETTVSGFDIGFNEDGTFWWHSGSDEGEGSWTITDDGKFNYFAVDYEIVELTTKIFKITDGEEETTFTRIDE